MCGIRKRHHDGIQFVTPMCASDEAAAAAVVGKAVSDADAGDAGLPAGVVGTGAGAGMPAGVSAGETDAGAAAGAAAWSGIVEETFAGAEAGMDADAIGNAESRVGAVGAGATTGEIGRAHV